jgi:S1-C subfamily serine protease
MLIATFGPTTGWVGKTITFEDGQFVLEGHGPVSAQAVLEYDRQGHLTWAYDGLQGWVRSLAAPALTPPAAPQTVAPQTVAPQTVAPQTVVSSAGAAGLGQSGDAASGLAPLPAVDLQRVQPGDWTVAGGFLALLLGTSLAWYSFSGGYLGFAEVRQVGWGFAVGWLSWLAGLVAVAVVVLASGVLPRLRVDFRDRAPLIVAGLGALAFLIVVFGLVTKPGYDESYGAGIFVSLTGAAAVTIGGLLLLGEPVLSGTARAVEVVRSMARPAAPASGGATAQAEPARVTAGQTSLWRRASFIVPLTLGVAVIVLLVALGLSLMPSKLSPQEIYQQHARSVVMIEATLAGTTDVFGQSSGSQDVLGTGFVVSPGGYILTNAHVVSEGGQVTHTVDVTFEDSTSQQITVRGTVVGADESTDVALIKVDPRLTPKLVPIPLGDSSRISVGEQVVAIGNPQGLDLSLSTGVVSATQRDLESPNGATISGGIQTDAAINPGSSGGPLIDSKGHVIGINEQITTESGGNEGIGFAVPINTAIRVMDTMKAGASTP